MSRPIDPKDPIFNGCRVTARMIQHVKISGPPSKEKEVVEMLRERGYSIYGPFTVIDAENRLEGQFVLEARETQS